MSNIIPKDDGEWLDFALGAARIGVYSWDLNTKKMQWDTRMHAHFGLAPESFSGGYDDFLELVDSIDRVRLAREIAVGLESDSEFNCEFKLLHANGGTPRFLEMHFKGRAKHGDRPVTGFCLDVTEKHRIAAELAIERHFLSMLMDNLPDLIYFKDRASRFTSVNRLFLARAGFSEQSEIIGKTDSDLYTEEHARAALADEQNIISSGKPLVGIEEKEIWPDGHVTWVSTSKVPWRDAQGEVVGTFGLSRDITLRKSAQVELESAQKQLLALSRRSGMAEIASSVLHNVGNALNGVNISLGVASEKIAQFKITTIERIAGLLREHAKETAYLSLNPQGVRLPQFLTQLAERFTADQKTVIDELHSLRTSIEHVNEIVAMQQNYASAGGVIETLPLADLIEDSLKMNAAAFDRHGDQVVREFKSDLPSIAVDRNKVLVILVNLIRNAKYACDEVATKDRRITVEAHINALGRVQISVGDNGLGIPKDNFPHLFEHGFTTRKGKGGHGFGLHGSALAAAELGGTLRAYSDGLGCGARFTLELPLSR